MAKDILSIIGRTPLLKLPMEGLSLLFGRSFESLNISVFAKLEFLNPLGSVKDRPVFYMLKGMAQEKRIKRGSVIVEASSGNTAIGLTGLSKVFGCEAVLVVPKSTSEKRVELMRFLGARVFVVDTMLDAVRKAEEIVSENKEAVLLDQFNNPFNAKAHYETTAPEIWDDLGGCVDSFIAGIGTGGTISGIGMYFKERKSDIKIIGVLPDRFPHKIQGIGAGFKPSILDESVIDLVLEVEEESVFDFYQRFPKIFGFSIGLSSCANLVALKSFLLDKKLRGNVVIIFADSGERYL